MLVQQGPAHAFRPRCSDPILCAFHSVAGDDASRCEYSRGCHHSVLQDPIEIEVYRPVPGKPGYQELDRRRLVHDVLTELNTKLGLEGVEIDEYGFTNMTKWDDPAWKASGYRDFALPWPAYRRIAVFPVTGGSEGHYVHVSVLVDGDRHQTIGLAKTFLGWDHACRISAATARLLQA